MASVNKGQKCSVLKPLTRLQAGQNWFGNHHRYSKLGGNLTLARAEGSANCRREAAAEITRARPGLIDCAGGRGRSRTTTMMMRGDCTPSRASAAASWTRWISRNQVRPRRHGTFIVPASGRVLSYPSIYSIWTVIMPLEYLHAS